MSYSITGCCEICNQRTFDDFNQDGICFSCLEEIKNKKIECSNCDQECEEIDDDGNCSDCALPSDFGDSDYNQIGGYSRSYINSLNNQFN